LVLPVHIAHAGDGSGRLFLVEQTGQVRIFQNGVIAPVPFLNISDRLSCCGERGLLSLAFPPQYAQKGYFYASYTNTIGNSVISRFFLTTDPNVANPASEVILLTVAQPFANHNGGQIAFGPDGYLYIGFGDGGSGGDPNNYAQNLNDLPGNQKYLGKMLRIDVESGVAPYAIPPTNPLLNGVRSEIWALGLRNPWRLSFDRQTGDLYIADVGQASYEEVNFQPAASPGGQNYGWRLMEGNHCFDPPVGCNTGVPILTLPVQEYDHTQGDCSVTGGFVYRGTQFASMQGVYFYGDFCSGRIRGLRNVNAIWQGQLLIDSTLNITTFGEDESGEIYVADYASGTIYKIYAIVNPERIGIFRQGNWYLDVGNDLGVWQGCALDSCLGPFGGFSFDVPVMGDWTGSGTAKIGIYRNGAWYLDRNGNGAWDGCGTTPGTDICFPSFGGFGEDVPVVGDWTGSGTAKIGIYRNGAWFLDRNGNGAWDGCGTTPGTDICFPSFGGFGEDIDRKSVV
jgi:glucose/arabinose dehydrogenase